MFTFGAAPTPAAAAAAAKTSAAAAVASADGGPPEIEEGEFGTLTTTPEVPGEEGEFTCTQQQRE